MSLRTRHLALVVGVVLLAGCGSGSGTSKTATVPATATAPARAHTSSTASPPTPSASTPLASPQYREWFIYEEETRHHRSHANATTFIDCLVPMWAAAGYKTVGQLGIADAEQHGKFVAIARKCGQRASP